MSLPATDNFNRGAQANLGANWTDQIGQLITNASNVCIGTDSAFHNAAYWNADVFSANQYSQCLAVGGATGFGGLQVRASGTAGTRTAYYALWGNGGARIAKVVNSVVTDLTTVGNFPDPSSTTVVILWAIDTTISIYYDGVLKESTTDSDIASGASGILLYGNTATIDDWQGGVATPPAPMFPMSRRTQYHFRRDVFRSRLV